MGLTCSILVDLWPEQTAHFVWHMNISQSQDFDLQYTVSAPTLNPTLTGPSLNYSLRPRLSFEWESAKCADLFSCPTVNTAWLRLGA